MRNLSTSLFFALIFAQVILILPTVQAQESKPRWFQDWDLARQASLAKKQPQLVYFFNHQARGCKLMQEETFTDPTVADLMSGFVLLAMNEQNQRARTQSLEVFRVPTIILLDSSGREIDRATGYKDRAAFSDYLTNTLRVQRGEVDRESEDFEYGAANILSPGPRKQPFTLRHIDPEANSVSIIGDFNDWRNGSTPMYRGENGEWRLALHLYEGVYQYLYLVNGSEYAVDSLNPLQKPSPYDTYNSVLIVGGAKYSPMVSGQDVTFILYNTEAQKIELAGDFNGWEPIEMFRKRDDPGMWGVRFSLPPGKYSYKYLIDGEWTFDPENYWPVKDQEGHINSSFIVR